MADLRADRFGVHGGCGRRRPHAALFRAGHPVRRHRRPLVSPRPAADRHPGGVGLRPADGGAAALRTGQRLGGDRAGDRSGQHAGVHHHHPAGLHLRHRGLEFSPERAGLGRHGHAGRRHHRVPGRRRADRAGGTRLAIRRLGCVLRCVSRRPFWPSPTRGARCGRRAIGAGQPGRLRPAGAGAPHHPDADVPHRHHRGAGLHPHDPAAGVRQGSAPRRPDGSGRDDRRTPGGRDCWACGSWPAWAPPGRRAG